MALNHVPKLSKNNPTDCCPEFNPKDWDKKIFEFKDKPFVRFTVSSFLYMPLNMNGVMSRILQTVANDTAKIKDENLMLSYDISPWQSEHFLAVTRPVPGLKNIQISGKFLSKVFEGPYRDVPKWMKSMEEYVKSKGKTAKKIFLNYTMCPKCSKFYGKNYVVAFAQV